MDIEKCVGYDKLKKAVIKDIESDINNKENKCEFHPEGCIKIGQDVNCSHHYCNKFRWVIERAEHYSQKTTIPADEVLNAWEEKRSYWYMNFYQDCNQPLIRDGDVYVFNTAEEFQKSVGDEGFRCPRCHQITPNPIECESGAKIDGKVCDWKSYGLFRTNLVHVLVKKDFEMAQIFKPVAWENKEN